jgi:hypothetical protein
MNLDDLLLVTLTILPPLTSLSFNIISSSKVLIFVLFVHYDATLKLLDYSIAVKSNLAGILVIFVFQSWVLSKLKKK